MYAVNGNQTHVSSVASLLRNFHPGNLTSLATAAALKKFHRCDRKDLNRPFRFHSFESWSQMFRWRLNSIEKKTNNWRAIIKVQRHHLSLSLSFSPQSIFLFLSLPLSLFLFLSSSFSLPLSLFLFLFLFLLFCSLLFLSLFLSQDKENNQLLSSFCV